MGCKCGKTAMALEPQTQKYVAVPEEAKLEQPATTAQDSADDAPADQPVVDKEDMGVTTVKEPLVAEVVLEDKVMKLEGCQVVESEADSTMAHNYPGAAGMPMKQHLSTKEGVVVKDLRKEPESGARVRSRTDSTTAQEELSGGGRVVRRKSFQEPEPEDFSEKHGIAGASNPFCFETPSKEIIPDAVTTSLEEDQVVVAPSTVTASLEEDQDAVPSRSRSDSVCPACGVDYAPCAQNCRGCGQPREEHVEEVEVEVIDGEVSTVAMDSPTSVATRVIEDLEGDRPRSESYQAACTSFRLKTCWSGMPLSQEEA